MKAIVAAIHGILTRQTDPSWPDRFDAWLYVHDPEVRVVKKEYAAGPFPRWNCLVRDPRLAQGLANEIELLVSRAAQACRANSATSNSQKPYSIYPPIWLIAHSNGAVIALLVTKWLMARGYRIGGLILTGAACEADVTRNGVLRWMRSGMLHSAIAYSSEDDHIVAGDTRAGTLWSRIWSWAWRQLIWPYGGLGRTGWLLQGQPFPGDDSCDAASRTVVFTRWFRGGHGAYFDAENEESTFHQIYSDVLQATLASSPCPPASPQTERTTVL